MAEIDNEAPPPADPSIGFPAGRSPKSLFASRYVSLDLFVIPQQGRIDLQLPQASIGLSPAPMVVGGRLLVGWDVIDLSKPVENRADTPQLLYALAPQPGAALYRFGSRVRGNSTPWSDSDFLILQPDDGESSEFRHGKVSLSLYRMSNLRAMAMTGSFFVRDVLANHQHLCGTGISLGDIAPSVRRIRGDSRYPLEVATMLAALCSPAIASVNPALTAGKLLWCARSAIFCRGKNPFCLSPGDAEHGPLMIMKDHAKQRGQSSHDIQGAVQTLLSSLGLNTNPGLSTGFGLTADSGLCTLDDLRTAFASGGHPEMREILYQLNTAEALLTSKG